jgi:hypothetical protein|tara:strand:- start:54 stop:227 length:174 start_codon:yes stop_codon:yes gene_type:complete
MNNLYLYLPIPDKPSKAFGDQTYNTIWNNQQKTITEAIEATTEEYERGVIVIDLYED